jgi:tetratricopeptide (TPR) repeat protein
MNPARRLRYAAYAIAVTVAFLAVLDGALQWLSAEEQIDLSRTNEQAWILHSDPWIDAGDGWYAPNPKATRLLPESRFKKEKGDGWRVFLLGASFLMGVPYSHGGSIPFWLQVELEARHPGQGIEVVNAAQSAQNAKRVSEIARYALEHEPDLLIVASCNNEGAVAPGEVSERLHRSGTFRLLRKLLKPEQDAQVPLHTPQDPDVDAVRKDFEEALEDILKEAARKKVPVLLATLPVNLRYDGHESGLPLQGKAWTAPGSEPLDPCIDAAKTLAAAGKPKEAEAKYAACDHVESLRGVGLAQYARGQFKSAGNSLEQYVELQPRNRCRPSFNRAIRALAERYPNAHLVDLEKGARDRSAHGLPGPAQFVDYCHLNWESQGAVADQFIDAMLQAKLGPPWDEVKAQLPPRKELYERYKETPLHTP